MRNLLKTLPFVHNDKQGVLLCMVTNNLYIRSFILNIIKSPETFGIVSGFFSLLIKFCLVDKCGKFIDGRIVIE